MRRILALPLLVIAACNVERDEANDQTTIEFNEQRVEDAASDVANVAESAGEAIENEVGDIDVDVDVDRNRAGNTN